MGNCKLRADRLYLSVIKLYMSPIFWSDLDRSVDFRTRISAYSRHGTFLASLRRGTMHNGAFLIIVDSDSRRRAELASLLYTTDYYLLPCEAAEEIFSPPPPNSLILTFDDGKSVGEAITQLLKLNCWTSVIAYSPSPKPQAVVDAVKAGATDYLGWPINPSNIAEAIKRIDACQSPADTAKYRELSAKNQLKSLSKREFEVAMAIRDGATSAMIAEQLNISPRTVEIHRANARKKLGAKSTAELVRLASEAEPKELWAQAR